MTIYPDTSFIVALRFAEDVHHSIATKYFVEQEAHVFLWSPWHRLEVSNTFRQLCLGERPFLNQAEARRIIRRLEADVRLGYFLHMEADWRDVLRAANEISAAHGFTHFCRAADLCHVAYAIELATDLFITFDTAQAELAEATGLNVIVPGDDPRPRG
jgi:predicted nucleic acid-binding protein